MYWHEKCLFHFFMYSALVLVYFDFVVWGSCSWYSGYFETSVKMDLGTYLLKKTTSLLKMAWLMYIRFEWLVLVEINCTRKTFGHFDKRAIDLVCDWFLRRCTVRSRYLKPSRDIEKVQAIGSSSSQELRTKDRKIRKKVLPYFYFRVSIHTVYIKRTEGL